MKHEADARTGESMIWRRAAVGIALAVCLAGCASGETDGDNRALSQHQRDSTIAESPLPGAGTVGRAMEIADSAEARRNQPLPGDR